jgi:regulator of replication initiation timing
MSNKLQEKWNQLTKKVDAYFADDVTEDTTEVVADAVSEEVTTNFMEVTLVDGETVLSYDGELAEGTAVFIVGEDAELIPATEGTYELGGDMAGTTITLDADGMVIEVVTTEAEEEVVEEEAMSSEDVTALVSKEIDALSTPLNAISKGLESLVNENKSLKEEITNLKADFEAFKETPSATEVESNKFSRKEDMSFRQMQILNNMKNKNK